MNCPGCGSADIHPRGKRYALYPAGIVSIIGITLSQLHQASTPYEYRCNRCGREFTHRTGLGRIVRIFFIAIILACAVLFAFQMIAEVAAL